MRSLTLFVTLALAFTTIACSTQVGTEDSQGRETSCNDKDEDKKRIIGYVFGQREVDIDRLNPNLLTHVNYAFANVVDNEAKLMSSRDKEQIKRLNALKERNPDLKILLSVGGWSWSGNFSDMALTEETRNIFAESLTDLIVEHDLDGIDIDWEYPGQLGDGNRYRAEDKQNFTLLLKEVRDKLDAMSDEEGRKGIDRYKLTIASGANQAFLDNTEMDRAHAYLDFINIMTYDFYGAWSGTSGHHANLFPSELQPHGGSASLAVEQHVDAGIPVEKLVLGVPFYARGWSGLENEHNGLYQTFEKATESVPYSTLKEHYINKNGFVRFWDDAAKAPYLWNEDKLTLYTYDDEESLKHKAEYINESGMSGAMFWEFSHDDQQVLLEILERHLLP